VAINCAALPQTLLEAELFGSRKGAFSGALEDRPGLVRASDGGTLFLDEIGDLPRASQPALLRVLQEREVLAVGATRPTPVDLRVVAATHRDLDEPDSDSFRADLRARLAGYTIKLSPLRERREDLGLLVGSLLRELAGDRAGGFRLTCGAGRWLLEHPWRLNIRELRQFLASAVARGRTEIGSGPPPAPPPGADPATDLLIGPAAEAASLSAADLALRAQLVDLLHRYSGNISAVARDLGKERIQIRRWIRRYGLQPRETPPPRRSA
jgi:transcriptional regulator with GAF, ATPase, and Fis domain